MDEQKVSAEDLHPESEWIDEELLQAKSIEVNNEFYREEGKQDYARKASEEIKRKDRGNDLRAVLSECRDTNNIKERAVIKLRKVKEGNILIGKLIEDYSEDG